MVNQKTLKEKVKVKMKVKAARVSIPCSGMTTQLSQHTNTNTPFTPFHTKHNTQTTLTNHNYTRSQSHYHTHSYTHTQLHYIPNSSHKAVAQDLADRVKGRREVGDDVQPELDRQEERAVVCGDALLAEHEVEDKGAERRREEVVVLVGPWAERPDAHSAVVGATGHLPAVRRIGHAVDRARVAAQRVQHRARGHVPQADGLVVGADHRLAVGRERGRLAASQIPARIPPDKPLPRKPKGQPNTDPDFTGWCCCSINFTVIAIVTPVCFFFPPPPLSLLLRLLLRRIVLLRLFHDADVPDANMAVV
eukprot:m.41570 g.41570  ORF g.41570 m.41570 type:complete len:306 (+) comp12019_c0_seq1:104-1021(+)